MTERTVYVGVRSLQSHDSSVAALEADTGSLVWRYALPDTSPSFPAASATGVYFSAANGSVYALRPADGSLLWQRTLSTQFPSPPVGSNDVLYVTTSDAVWALQATDGSLLWQQPLPNLSPIRPVVAGEQVYARSLSEGSISALRARDGALLWRTPSQGERLISLVAAPDVVYLVGSDRGLSALRADDGSLLWQQTGRYTNLRNPLLHQEVLYLSVPEGVLARRASDGSLLWRVGVRDLHGTRSLAATNSLLIVCDVRERDCEVSAVRTADGTAVWHWRTLLQEGGVTDPVVTRDAVYIGIGATHGLFALQASTGSILWHVFDDFGVTSAAVGERRR